VGAQDVLLALLRGGVITNLTTLLEAGGSKIFIERLAIGLLLASLVFLYVSVTRESRAAAIIIVAALLCMSRTRNCMPLLFATVNLVVATLLSVFAQHKKIAHKHGTSIFEDLGRLVLPSLFARPSKLMRCLDRYALHRNQTLRGCRYTVCNSVEHVNAIMVKLTFHVRARD
jgi:hypothetical protein